VEVSTALAPLELLEALQRLQHRAGRRPGGMRFGPRLLDLDIIFYGALVMDSARLTIPHPRMHQRRFVLQPICDIDPAVRHPVFGRSVQALLDDIDPEGQEIRPCYD
jgi:2-amino-4-hydroxy-6-hydroxymethyldihydropteridine diphosphokinase